jgi:hypothetical protein
MPPAALTAENNASTAWLPCGNDPLNGPVRPLTLPNVMDVGETPTSDAVLPVLPLHAPASAAGEKSNPDDVGEAAGAGALEVAGAAPAPECAPAAGPAPGLPLAEVLTPGPDDVPGPVETAPPAAVVVVAPTACAADGPELVPPLPLAPR